MSKADESDGRQSDEISGFSKRLLCISGSAQHSRFCSSLEQNVLSVVFLRQGRIENSPARTKCHFKLLYLPGRILVVVVVVSNKPVLWESIPERAVGKDSGHVCDVL